MIRSKINPEQNGVPLSILLALHFVEIALALSSYPVNNRPK
jgi:hypothetical protein